MLILGMIILSWGYSMPPFRTKRFPIVATFTLALISLLAAYAGFFAVGALSLQQFPAIYSLPILIFVSLGFNVKDLKDIDSDRKAGVKSLPVIFGEEKARKVISLLVALSYLSAFALTQNILLLPFSMFFALLSDFMLRKAKLYELPLLLTYFAFAAIFVWIVL